MRAPMLRTPMMVVMAGVLTLAVLGACHTTDPKTPVGNCIVHCEQRLEGVCSSAECERGCEFILDRLVEHETNNVLTCVASRRRRCGDVVWADCAAHIGPHADGGPPGPAPPSEDD